MVKFGRSLILGVLLVLPACNRHVAVECAADDAKAPVVSIVKEALEKAIAAKVQSPTGAQQVSLSKIRAAIGQLVIAIEDIRTSKEDPNSTKRFCSGTLAITTLAESIADAETARQAAQLNSVDQLSDQNDVKRSANKFSTDLEFNIQPTDDGSKIFAQTESGKNMFEVVSEVMASALMKSAVLDATRQQQQAEQQQQVAQDAALAEQRAANLNAAKTENQLSIQAINALWQSLAPEVRANLLPLQKAWVRKKVADCKVEAASASIDPTEQRVTGLQCESRANHERMDWLNQYQGGE